MKQWPCVNRFALLPLQTHPLMILKVLNYFVHNESIFYILGLDLLNSSIEKAVEKLSIDSTFINKQICLSKNKFIYFDSSK